MRSHSVPLAAALAALVALPAAADAAQVATDRGCYLENQKVALNGSGFTPGAAYQVTIDGQPLTGGTGTVSAAGTVTVSFTPNLAAQGRRVKTHVYALAVVEGANRATSEFAVTKFTADFAPTAGNPQTLRVRFSLFGFGLVSPRPSIYIHSIRPNGKLRTTVALGRATGPCGSISRTARRRLFPFAGADRGEWKLQFDTSRRYRKGSAASDFLFYIVGVRIRRLR
jgi:hypothetical protein